jgi:hypothetical protein
MDSRPLQAALRILQKAGKLHQLGNEFLPSASYEDIIDTANDFINEQGFVTTLQIKGSLREDGYFVKQHDISLAMTEAVENDLFKCTHVNTDGKQHRLFFDETVPERIAVLAYQEFM